MEGCQMPSPIRSLTDNRIEHAIAGRAAPLAAVRVSRRAIAAALASVAAALALILLGGALAHVLGAGRATTAPLSRSARASAQQLSLLPAAAQATVSSALGSADPRYRVSAVSGGFQALNPRQRLRVRFARADVLLGAGAASLGISVQGLADGDGSQTPAVVLAHAAGNRVLYTGSGLSEWFANGPLGLEQGFTVERAPAGRASGSLTLSLALTGATHLALAAGGGSILISSRGGPELRYGDLSAGDARGRSLRSRLAIEDGRILVRVDTRGARYPLRIDPLVQQAKLSGGEEAAGEGRFAASVALSADGDTALIGAPDDDGGMGAAWVFARSGATWTQQGPKLTGGQVGVAGGSECEIEEPGEEEPGECGFGKSVALSADGDTALVGGPGADGNLGAVWVFVRAGSTWSQQGAVLTGGEERLKGHFGRSVALAGDGSTALVGGPGDAGYAGAAWVFTRAGTSWSEQAELTPPESGSIDLGRSVALSGDGHTAVVGAPGAAGRVGAAWVYGYEEGVGWTRQAELAPGSGGGEDRFGYSVAISADARTALVGERAQPSAGAAWAFTDEASGWGAPQKLTGAEAGDEGRFGYSVALSANGSSALVGDPGYSGATGAAWLFTRSSQSFGSGEMLSAAGEHGSGQLGSAVALSASGEGALLGAPSTSDRTGAAWAFVVPAAPPTVTGVSPAEGPTSGGTKVTITGSGFDEAIAVDFGSVAAQSFEVNPAGTSITAESPKEAAGSVDVTVSVPGATSAIGDNDLFTFVAPAKKTGHREPGNETETPVTVETAVEGTDNTTTSGGGGQSAVLSFGSNASPTCTVTLLGKSIAVRKRARATLRLIWRGAKGTLSCRGRLTLALKVKRAGRGKARYRTVIIGTAGFSIVSGTSRSVTVRLNARGRARLRADHGRLAARVTILVLTPSHSKAQTSVKIHSVKSATLSSVNGHG
jgi:hypothetical protein